jgi:hypothetical protein
VQSTCIVLYILADAMLVGFWVERVAADPIAKSWFEPGVWPAL